MLEKVWEKQFQLLIEYLSPNLRRNLSEFSSIGLKIHQKLFKKRFDADERKYFFNPAFEFKIIEFAVSVDETDCIIEAHLIAENGQILFSNVIYFFQIG